mgnify:CR=1 FL=1
MKKGGTQKLLFFFINAGMAQASACLVQFCFKLRQDGEQVAHNPVIRHLEDRRFGVLVDGHDHLAVLHARKVLDRA